MLDDESDVLVEFSEFDTNFSELNESNEFYDEKFKIISEFMAADKDILKVLDYRYTSKFISTHDISQRHKERSDKFKMGSKGVKLEIPDN
ncbi:8827_t:CDS:2 [Gigaspora rosea]|nr:8827_t:CDS:2 [Gigaspora rosea]